MKVIVPMAGLGRRLTNCGYARPKPLIYINRLPMVVHALESLTHVDFTELIFVVLKEHEQRYQVSSLLAKYVSRPFHVVYLDQIADGQLCSVLAARQYCDCEEDVLIAPSDSFIVSDLSRAIETKEVYCEGIISVAKMSGDKWSFVRLSDDRRVVEVAEKKRISDLASTGLYYFSSGRKFLKYADQIIQKNLKVKGEFYVMPVYQEFIDDGLLIEISMADQLWDMGTPDALLEYKSYLNRNSGSNSSDNK